MTFDLGRVENIVGKGENAGNQHFLLFPQCFQKTSLSGSLKVGIRIVELTPFFPEDGSYFCASHCKAVVSPCYNSVMIPCI